MSSENRKNLFLMELNNFFCIFREYYQMPISKSIHIWYLITFSLKNYKKMKILDETRYFKNT